MTKFVGKIVAYSLKNHVIILFFTFLLVAGGIIAIKNTLVEAYPDVTNTRARIITQWPGRSAEEIEKFVTLPVTREMSTIPGKTDVRSISLFGLSVVTVNFTDDITDFYAQQYASNRMRNVDLPEGADAEIEPPYGATGEIFRYVIKGKDQPIRELSAIQEWVIERELLSVPGVADVVSFGGEEKSYEIRVNPVELTNYGLSALDVFEAVSKSNINVGGDVIQKGSQAYVVRGIGLLDKTSDIENILITNIKNTPVLVKNVASVAITGKPRLGQAGLNDENDLVEGVVVMLRGENPGRVIERLRERVADLNNRILPKDVQIVPFLDRTELVDKTITTVTHNLIEGILLVSVVVFIFLFNWRTTLIVASVIPLAFLFALLMLRVQGLSANLISIGAVDFGLLLEGTLVIVEHVFVGMDKRAREMGMPAFNLMQKDTFISDRAKSVGKSILFAQVILIVALLPIFTFQKVEGKMFSPLAFTLGYALLGSLILSLTYVPVMNALMFRKKVTEKESPIITWSKKKYVPVLKKILHKRILVTGIASAFVIISLIIFPFLGSEFIPQLDEGSIALQVLRLPSISLTTAVNTTSLIEKEILNKLNIAQLFLDKLRVELAGMIMAKSQKVGMITKDLKEKCLK